MEINGGAIKEVNNFERCVTISRTGGEVARRANKANRARHDRSDSLMTQRPSKADTGINHRSTSR